MANAEERLLERIRTNFHSANESEQHFRPQVLLDHKFARGDGQWDDQIEKQRQEDNRPCLTINRVLGNVHQIVNEVRRNTPTAKASPVEKNDIDASEIFTGLIREIDRRSNADAVRTHALSQAVRGGIGWYKIATDWVSPQSWDQELWLHRILDWASVYMDPAAQMPDKSDGEFAFEVNYMRRKEFERKFPKSEIVSSNVLSGVADVAPIWVNASGVLFARYWEKQKTEAKLVMLADGKGKLEDELTEDDEPIIGDNGKFVTRVTEIVTIKEYHTNGVEILEENDWPSTYIPLIPVIGEETVIEGQRDVSGNVRPSLDSQRSYNVMASVQTEAMNAGGKTPIIATPEQTKGFEKQYSNANKGNQAVRYYNPHVFNGVLIPPPGREVVEPPIQALAQSRMMAADDIKATSGIFDASLGNRSNETSGIAIDRRRDQGETANFHFVKNLHIAITLEKRIQMDMIPDIYSRKGRVARILGENGDERLVELNVQTEDRGKTTIYDLGAAKYDMVVEMGPSVKTQRQETAEFVEKAIGAYPGLMEIAGHILFENSDVPGSREIAEALREKFGIDDEKGEKVPAKAKAQIQQLAQINEALVEQLEQMSKVLETKQLERESEERIAAQKAEVDMIKAEIDLVKETMKLETTEAVEEVRARAQKVFREIDQRQAVLKEKEPVGSGSTNGSK